MTVKIAVSALLLGAALAVPGVKASILFGVEFPGDTDLYTVDQNTGAISSVGSTGTDQIGDLTSDTRAGSFTLWGVRIADNELITLDPLTGAVTSTVALDSTSDMVSIAFDPVTGLLYGNTAAAFGQSADALYSINPLTGTTSLIGAIGFSNVFALAFDQGGNLFGVSDSTNELVAINTATGAGAAVGLLTLGLSFDIASRPEDNIMFLADSSTSSLYTLDTSTGAAVLVGPYGSATNIVGLAFSETVIPEPSTFALAATGLVLAAIGLRRRRRQS